MKTTATIAVLAMSIATVPAQNEPKQPAPDVGSSTAKAASGPADTQVKVGPITIVTAVIPDGKLGAAKRGAYLGIETSPVTPAVRAQVGLQEGMGLTVESVAKGSPAEKAGVARYDVLKKFNDQMICNADQLAALVAAAGKGSAVSLVVIRGAAEKSLPVTLGEHEVAVPDVKFGGTWSSADGPKIDIQIDKLAEALKPLGVNPQEIMQQLQDQIFKPQKEKPLHGITDNAEAAERRAREREERAAKPQPRSFVRPGGSSQSTVVIKDSDGEIQIHETNGESTVQIRNASGEEVYRGPLNSEQDYDAVPEKFRDKVHKATKNLKRNAAKAEGKGDSA